MKKMLKWILIFFGIVIVISIFANGSDKSKDSDTSSQPAATQETVTQQAQQAAEQPAEKPKPKQWVKIYELSGTDKKTGDTFETEGGKVRLTYALQGNDYASLSIYVVDEGTSLEETGGFPVADLNKSGSDSTIIRKGAGQYYLDINVVNATGWSVTVEEEK